MSSIERFFARSGLVKVGLAPAKDHDAAPLGVEHAGRAFCEALEESGQMPGLSRVNGQLHQLLGFSALRTRRYFGFAAATETARSFTSCSRHV